jgi:hypothetical protein
MFGVLWKFCLRLLVITSFILGIVGPLLTPLSQVAFWGMTWERIIILTFLIGGMIIYIQTEIENRKRPNIKVRPLVSDRAAVLEVFNKGGISQFRVLAKIMRNHSRGPAITLCWEPGGNKSEIERDGSGTIIVAYQFGVGLLNTPTMTSEGKKHLTIAAWPLDKWGEPQTDLPPDDVYLEISITADKNLRKTFSRMIFKLTQTSFTNLHFEYVKSESRKLKIEKDGFLK